MVDKITGLWDEDKEASIRQMKEYLYVIEISKARTSLIEAKNFYILSELYLSDKISRTCQEVFKNLAYILTETEYPEPGSHNVRQGFIEVLDQHLDEIRKEMKKELGKSYYVE